MEKRATAVLRSSGSRHGQEHGTARPTCQVEMEGLPRNPSCSSPLFKQWKAGPSALSTSWLGAEPSTSPSTTISPLDPDPPSTDRRHHALRRASKALLLPPSDPSPTTQLARTSWMRPVGGPRARVRSRLGPGSRLQTPSRPDCLRSVGTRAIPGSEQGTQFFKASGRPEPLRRQARNR